MQTAQSFMGHNFPQRRFLAMFLLALRLAAVVSFVLASPVSVHSKKIDSSFCTISKNKTPYQQKDHHCPCGCHGSKTHLLLYFNPSCQPAEKAMTSSGIPAEQFLCQQPVAAPAIDPIDQSSTPFLFYLAPAAPGRPDSPS